MKLYADTVVRRTRQIVSDVWMVVWAYAWIRVGTWTHELVMNLAAPGRKLAEAGTGLEDGLLDAGEKASNIPLAGDRLQRSFDDVSGSGGALRDAGNAQVDAVEKLALFLGITIAVMPILLLLVLWLPRRIAFIREATAAQKFIDAAPDLDLFALRALANQPMTVLAGVSDDPAGAWRARDTSTVRRLAALELAATGLKPPRM